LPSWLLFALFREGSQSNHNDTTQTSGGVSSAKGTGVFFLMAICGQM